MTRRTLTLTTLTTTAALLLTACGGSGGGKGDDIKGAATGSGSPSASASGWSPAPSDVKRPVITLPSNFQLTFENWTSSDPVKRAVLNDAKEQLRAGYAAITANKTKSEALSFYNTESGLLQVQQWIRTYTEKDLTVIGKLPIYDPKVSLAKTGIGAYLTYCSDESKAYSKDRKTGKEEGNPAGTDPHVFYAITLGKNAKGVWQTRSARSERGACS
ncbi:hypothetical protein [Streptomyces sp. NPDC051636]|uniref:hypothetical protein n=1 Tax=Streptomyces sp. NPDC051636 TaxID=3365663 RepID=UPI0037A363F5